MREKKKIENKIYKEKMLWMHIFFHSFIVIFVLGAATGLHTGSVNVYVGKLVRGVGWRGGPCRGGGSQPHKYPKLQWDYSKVGDVKLSDTVTVGEFWQHYY